MDQAEAPKVQDHGAAPAPPPRRKRQGRFGFTMLITLIVLSFTLGFGALALTGKTLRLPVWAVAELEARLNRAVLPGLGLPAGSALSVGGIDILVDRDLVPRFGLQDLRILKPGGASLLTLPEARVALDPGALIRGRISPSTLRISGARLAVARGRDGAFDFVIGGAAGARAEMRLGDFAAVLDAVDAAFARPGLAGLTLIEADALSFTLQDARAGRTWDVGDGRLVIENRAGEVRAEASLSLLGPTTAARAVVSVISSKADSGARITATVDGVAAADIAAQAPPLTFLQVLDAPISGRIDTALTPAGRIASLSGELTLAEGALQASPEAQPIAFDRAALALAYDPALARITVSRMMVESPSLRVMAEGQAYLLDAAGQPSPEASVPAQVLGQLVFSDVRVDPAGLFVEPVRFSSGAVDLRLRLDPFRLDLGQLSLSEGEERLLMKGTVTAEPEGWRGGLDVSLNRITADRLMTLWPVTAVPRTRDWLVANVQDGLLFDVQAALRLTPGAEPRFSLGYEFTDTQVTFLKTLPPIEEGDGRATIEGTSYTIVLDAGRVTPPLGGDIDMAGSVFRVPDITAKPARAEITLATDSSLTAALSLLDEPPFRFLAKAGQPVGLGTGRARFEAYLELPLIEKVLLPDIIYRATGVIGDFRSDVIVPGRTLTAPELAVRLDKDGLSLSGEGTLGEVPFDVTYAQSFLPEAKGKARVEGAITLSAATLKAFGIELPPGSVSGQGAGQVTIDLTRGKPARLRLVSDTNRLGLRLDALGWTKPAATLARLEAEATLGPRAEVTRLALKAPGLTAEGRVTTREGGGLDVAEFTTLQVGDWLDASVRLTGRGKGRAVGIAVTGGSLDLRRMPEGGAGGDGGGSPFTLALDQVIVTQTIALTGFRGEFSPRGGLNGSFTAAINQRGPVQGTVVPGRRGAQVRLVSDDAGAVMSAAGIMENGRGGSLDLRLQPTGEPGNYAGRADFRDLRVTDAPVLAELLSAVSVVGLLEQMNGAGLLFNEGEVDFLLSPRAVQITRGSAVGLSLGISMAGLYRNDTQRIDLQGTVSPLYMLNGIGALFSRRGEGLFGFNYRLSGPVSDPDVSVNPLSILTPGMFREIFRRTPPTLKGSGG